MLHRELVSSEREFSVEIQFEPESKQELFLACLWRRGEAIEDEAAFYSFAISTRETPPKVAATGHNRYLITIKPENLDA
jgi:hypothetical protein